MKYIYYIIFIACAFSVGVALLIQNQPAENSNYAITINDRKVSTEEFEKKLLAKPPHINKKEFVDSVINKELLIQEAKKLGIDEEESFRMSIQDFYEQSLTKLLMERKYKELKGKPTKQEIDRYIELLGREVSLTLLEPESSKAGYKTRSTITDFFDNLSTDLQVNILQLKPGSKSDPIRIFGEMLVIKLNSVGGKEKPSLPNTSRSKIDKIISEYKKELLLQNWIDELRKKASIHIDENKTS